MDYAALAKQFGAVGSSAGQSQPSGGNWMGGLSPKDQAELKMKMYEEGRKRVSELNGQISQAQPVLSDLNEFGRLNRQTATGSAWDNFMPGNPVLHGEDVNRMQAIQSRLGPAQRPTGSGSSSDTDVRLFMGGLPSVRQEGDVNKGIREDFQRKYDYAVRKRNAMLEYLNKNGNLNDFDTQWADSQAPKAAPATNQNSRAPAGIDPALWSHMTPQERALWQK